jgi:hypothetical protein
MTVPAPPAAAPFDAALLTAAPPAAPQPVVTGPRGGTGRRLLVAAGAVVLAAASAGVTWFFMRDAGTEQAAATPPAYGAPLSSSPRTDVQAAGETEAGRSGPASSTTGAAPTTSAAPTPVVMTEERALLELGTWRAESRSRVVLDGRWVAQVASKSVGITDPLQWADNGTHTFYAVDILAESRRIQDVVSDPSSVLMLQSTDFGKRSTSPDGRLFWVTVVDGGFSSGDEVKLWCARTFPTLSAEQLANACAARTLAPPHS